MSYLVSASGAGSLTLAESNTVSSVLQNIAVILGTRQGTVPMYREFGLSMKFLDRPMNAARALMVSEITEAINEFEPRATVLSVTFAYDESSPGTIIPTVEVEISE